MFRRQRRSEDDVSEEIRAHLELETEDLVAEGLSEQQARAAARRDFGSVALTRQRLYEKGRVLWLDDLARDLRHSVALFRRAPGFTFAVMVTLALGIGLNTAIFSFVNALLLRPLPVPDSDRLVTVHTSDFSGPAHGSTGYPDYVDFRDNGRRRVHRIRRVLDGVDEPQRRWRQRSRPGSSRHAELLLRRRHRRREGPRVRTRR